MLTSEPTAARDPGATGRVETLVDTLSRAEHHACAATFSDYSLYQTGEYADVLAEELGARVSTLAVRRDGRWLGAAVMRVRTLPLLGGGVAYGLYAPLWQQPGATRADLEMVLSAIRDEYGGRRDLSVRLRPKVALDGEHVLDVQQALAATGFRLQLGVRRDATFWLDLTPSLEEIRGRFQRRWRNYLSQAEKVGLGLRTDGEDASFAVFLDLYRQMKERKEFEGVDPQTIRRVNAQLPAERKIEITLAYQEGQPIAAHLASHLGDTCLGLLAATSHAALDCRAANLVWWERIRRAKAAGLKWYDLGGYDYETNPAGAESKRKLGGRPVVLVGEYRYEPSPRRAALTAVAEKGYRMLRRRRST